MSNIIYLTQAGHETIAWITEIPHRQHAMYQVEFDSGYENIFFTDVESGLWVEEDLGFTSLAAKVGREIKKLMRNPYHVPKLLTWHHSIEKEMACCFGFFRYMQGNHRMYEVYGNNRKYMYTLSDLGNNEWQIMGNSTLYLDRINAAFVQEVINVFPLYK